MGYEMRKKTKGRISAMGECILSTAVLDTQFPLDIGWQTQHVSTDRNNGFHLLEASGAARSGNRIPIYLIVLVTAQCIKATLRSSPL